MFFHVFSLSKICHQRPKLAIHYGPTSTQAYPHLKKLFLKKNQSYPQHSLLSSPLHSLTTSRPLPSPRRIAARVDEPATARLRPASQARPGRRLLPDAAALRKERRQLEALRHSVRRAMRRGDTAASATGVADHPSTSPPLPPAGHTTSLSSSSKHAPSWPASRCCSRPRNRNAPTPATSASPSTVSATATSPGSRIADASQETGSAGNSSLNPSMQLNPSM